MAQPLHDEGFISHLLSKIDPSVIYGYADVIAQEVFYFLTPTLVVIMLYVRLTTASLDTIVGSGKYTELFKDVLLFMPIIGLYFILADFTLDFFRELYDWADDRGNTRRITEQLEGFIAAVSESDKDASFTDVFVAPGLLVAWGIHTLSSIVLLVTTVFLRFAHAAGLSFIFVWGCIALPAAIAAKDAILKPWLVFAFGLLIWPVISYLITFFFVLAAQDMADIDITAMTRNESKINAYIGFTILNSLLWAVTAAAPFITVSLVRGNGSINGLVMPFMGAALGVSSALTKPLREKMSQATSGVAGSARVGMGRSVGELANIARTGLGIGPKPNPQGPSPNPPGSGGSSSSNHSASSSHTSSETTSSTPGGSTVQTASKAAAMSSAMQGGSSDSSSAPSPTESNDRSSKQQRKKRRGHFAHKAKTPGAANQPKAKT